VRDEPVFVFDLTEPGRKFHTEITGDERKLT